MHISVDCGMCRRLHMWDGNFKLCKCVDDNHHAMMMMTTTTNTCKWRSVFIFMFLNVQPIHIQNTHIRLVQKWNKIYIKKITPITLEYDEQIFREHAYLKIVYEYEVRLVKNCSVIKRWYLRICWRCYVQFSWIKVARERPPSLTSYEIHSMTPHTNSQIVALRLPNTHTLKIIMLSTHHWAVAPQCTRRISFDECNALLSTLANSYDLPLAYAA